MFEGMAYTRYMRSAFQASLLDEGDEIGLAELGPSVRRSVLEHGAWVDTRPGWLTGADALFERLVQAVPWQAEKRHMYDRVVDVPRLQAFYDEGEVLPDPILEEAKQALDAHYADELGEPFRTAGLCLYRDGRDSVAWHGDTIGRGKNEDTIVAIIAVGSPRTLMLRPRQGVAAMREARRTGKTRRFELGHGDLFVMGGTCQRTWEHAIPKSAKAAGARISIQFRPRDVR
jgi:alkylated DNA repair dioxygenase AlkB